MKAFLSRYKPSYPKVIIYMLQSCEYDPVPYVKWYSKTSDFSKVIYRRKFDATKAAQLLLTALRLGIAVYIILSIMLSIFGWLAQSWVMVFAGFFMIVIYPFIWPYIIILPLIFGKKFITDPSQRNQIVESKTIFAKSKATKIAIAGSYGKTSMKELLVTVLSEGKKVAATPANKNVAISHARFAKELTGEEDIIILEYGEGKPGDVKEFAKTTHPDIGIITGLAPAHLDKYKTVQAAGEDIMSLADYLNDKSVYVSGESQSLGPFIKDKHHIYNQKGVLDWKISNIKISKDGLSFTMKHGKKTLNLKSGLLGRHQIAPLALSVALADKLGLSKSQIEKGISKTQPFEHRMYPKDINGATIIDDTYNGNLEGIKAGLNLLKELPAKRKIYITPGLVDQGDETESVHIQIGQMIADTRPDMVILMNNSVTRYIEAGLEDIGYKGRLIIEEDPLAFYTDLASITANGDVVLMQNDWTDNYQ